ncbi:hypothetical protein HYI01_11005 [Clostridium botulinum]|nr:hypothetical protein [Clostridium botulinum]MBY7001249.1 hypothetical protein [Clostridium botulinum]MCR1274016.1 hypothetical protein [Clostridium botulinum]
MRKFIPISIIAILLISYINYNKVDRFPNEIPTIKLIISEKYNTKIEKATLDPKHLT